MYQKKLLSAIFVLMLLILISPTHLLGEETSDQAEPAHGWALTWGSVPDSILDEMIGDEIFIGDDKYIVGITEEENESGESRGAEYIAIAEDGSERNLPDPARVIVLVMDMATNAQGDIFIVGIGRNGDIRPGPGIFIPELDQPFSHLIKLDRNGNYINAETVIGNDSLWTVYQTIDIDINDDVLIAGNFAGDYVIDSSRDLKISGGVDWLNCDCFIVKYDPEGIAKWVYSWGGDDRDEVSDIVTDSDGNIYIGGRNDGPCDFNPDSDSDEFITGENSGYVFSLTANGDFRWVNSWDLGDEWTNVNTVTSLTVDSGGDVLACGGLINDIVFGDITISGNERADSFVVKLDSDGEIQWVNHWGSEGIDFTMDIATDSENSVYVCGSFAGEIDFDSSESEFPASTNDSEDLFIGGDCFLVKLDESGTFLDAVTWGGSDSDRAKYLGVDSSDNVFVTGWYSGEVDFDPSDEEYIHPGLDWLDIHLSKFSSDLDFEWASFWAGESTETPDALTIDENGNVIFCGNADYTLDFDPSSRLHELMISDESFSSGNAFVVKVLPNGTWHEDDLPEVLERKLLGN